MDYVEKRKKGRERIFKKQNENYHKEKRLMVIKEHPISITNEYIIKSKYKGLVLNEKKLHRYVLSLIKKEDDINTNYLIQHKTVQELFNHHYTSKDIYDMLCHISSSFHMRDKKGDYYHIPIFKLIHTSEDCETSEVIFNEAFSKGIFFNYKDTHFLKYDLGQIKKHKNLYSPDLFELLLSITRSKREEIVSIEMSIEELKEQLGCETYENKIFLRDIIKKSINDININNKSTLGGTVEYKYNKTKKTITFYTENTVYMLKLEKQKGIK